MNIFTIHNGRDPGEFCGRFFVFDDSVSVRDEVILQQFAMSRTAFEGRTDPSPSGPGSVVIN